MLFYFIRKIKAQCSLLAQQVTHFNFWLLLLTDSFLLVLAFNLAEFIRFADDTSGAGGVAAYSFFSSLLTLTVCIKIVIFYVFGLYRGMWRYTSYSDLLNILRGTFVSSLAVVSFLLYLNRFQGISRSVFIIDCLLTFLFISGNRVAIRFFYRKIDGRRSLLPQNTSCVKKRLLLIGAGASAEKVLRELNDNPRLPYEPVGLLDDNSMKVGMKIHGVPVVGMISDIREHVHRMEAQEILISIASATGSEMRRIVAHCQETKIPFKILPGIGELIDGTISVKSIRDISYADLLGRKEVRLEQDKIGGCLKDKVVLITGAGGTIGSELCRQILAFSPKLLILFDAAEENLYSIQMELLHEYNCHNIVPILGKIQDQKLLNIVFQQYSPSVVFHAAAYKHVPLIENNPWQAVENNVLAAQFLIETSIRYSVERFVLVSTDKAVRPANVMGASKRLTELLMLAYTTLPPRTFSPPDDNDSEAEHYTVFMAVRFGNVLGSSGSVIPLFKRQIELGGPVTVTHPEITRYFMSIEEAAQLILQAGAMGEGGEIFILKMGEPIKIAEMARGLIKLAGRTPDTEIEIKYTGLREGEKLYEELITEGEGIVETDHEKIMVLRGDGGDCCNLFSGIEQLRKKAEEHDSAGIKDVFKEIIPEYTPDYETLGIRNDTVLSRPTRDASAS